MSSGVVFADDALLKQRLPTFTGYKLIAALLQLLDVKINSCSLTIIRSKFSWCHVAIEPYQLRMVTITITS